MQSLVQILEENGFEAEARVWARWAMHRDPGLSVTSVNLGPNAAALFNAARSAIATDSLVGPATVSHDWSWPPGVVPAGPGTIEVGILPSSLAATAMVLGTGAVPASGILVATGIYDAVITGPDIDSVHVRLEVLPGVTTRLTVTPRIVVVAVPDSMLQPESATRMAASLVPVRASRYGLPESCEWGVRVGRELVLTRYAAIRGATDATVAAVTGPPVTASVAQYDAAAQVALLQSPGALGDSTPVGGPGFDADYLWLIGGEGCEGTTPQRMRVASVTGPYALLTSVAGADAVGSMAIDQQGAVVGFLHAADTVRLIQATAMFAAARASPRRLTLAQVAQAENHILGALDIAMTGPGVVTVQPLEPWHWPGLGTSFAGSGRFVGPLGRYRIDVTDAAGQFVSEQEVLLRPEETIPVQALAVVAAQPGIDVPRAKGGFPIILVVLGGGAAAAAAVLLLGGGGDGGGNGTGSGFGSVPITISIP